MDNGLKEMPNKFSPIIRWCIAQAPAKNGVEFFSGYIVFKGVEYESKLCPWKAITHNFSGSFYSNFWALFYNKIKYIHFLNFMA